MEDRAAIPPTLPKPNSVRSYWWEPLSDIAGCRTTEDLPSTPDIVIIGSGISGATIAYNLLSAQPHLNVCLLEARQAASGASGRNGGHTKTASYRPFVENVKLVGAEDAVKIARLEYNCMKAVHAFIADNNIAADSLRCDTVDVFYDDAQWQGAQESVVLMRKLMGKDDPAPPYDFYDSAKTASNYLCPDSCGSLKYESGSLNAYKLTIAVLKMALSKNLNLQCNTPATSITRTANAWTIATSRGAITTPKVILATNGYTAHLLPQLQGVIVPFRGVVTAQRPGLSLPQHGLPTTYSMVYKSGYEYMITRPRGTDFEGDIVIGGGLTKAPNDGEEEYGNTDDTTIQPDIEKYLLECTKSYFGDNWGKDNPEGQLRKTWTGIMGYSADGHPLIGPVPGQKGLYLSASFQGHGMVLCFLCAKACAKMVLDDGDDDKDLKSWFPDCYRVSEERLKKRFKGRLKVTGANEVSQEGEEEKAAKANGTIGVNGVH